MLTSLFDHDSLTPQKSHRSRRYRLGTDSELWLTKESEKRFLSNKSNCIAIKIIRDHGSTALTLK